MNTFSHKKLHVGMPRQPSSHQLFDILPDVLDHAGHEVDMKGILCVNLWSVSILAAIRSLNLPGPRLLQNKAWSARFPIKGL